ncbi:Pycsar system effector family protein [Kitasatospora paranensis]|uniref:Pycsar system effector family protein n=2 Tax=Kitasatospora paranensis TaxID=258053 RepID=A0ABW2G724_9ACTN
MHVESQAAGAVPVQGAPTADSGSVDRAWRILDGVTASINQADTKAGVALAAAGVLGGVLFNLVDKHPGPGPWAVAAVVATAALSLAAAACAGAALYPRRHRTGAAPGLLYFGHIVRGGWTADTFGQPLGALLGDPSALTAQITAQVWANAQIADAKFDWVNRAMRLLLAAFLAAGCAASAVAAGV